MFFYRDDGLYAFYDVRPDGSLGAKLSGGTGYTKGSSSIAAIDLNGDNKDDLFFYHLGLSLTCTDLRLRLCF